MTSNYIFYINEIRLPIPPSKYTCKYSNKNKTETLINNGEINILKTPGLTEFSFDVMLPHQPYPFAIYENGFMEPQYFLAEFSVMKEKNTPIYFKVLRKSASGIKLFDNDNFKCTLESFSYTEDAEKGADITVSITLKQYRDYCTIKYIMQEDGTMKEESERAIDEEKKEEIPTEDNIKEYTVVEGDCLWNICKKYYGDGSKCWEVAKNNNITNPNLIYPGQVIRLA